MSYRVNPLDIRYKAGPNCDGCPFRRWSIGFVPPWGDLKRAKYLLIPEYSARLEVAEGLPLVGPTGDHTNDLLHLAGIDRSNCAICNVVLCRPIRWVPHRACKGKGCSICQRGMVPHRQGNKDFVNDPPSPAQLRFCANRYLTQVLKDFQGDTVVGLGKSSLTFFAGGARKITKYRGTKFEHGEMIQCERCWSSGVVPGGFKTCPTCKGKLVVTDENALVPRGIPFGTKNLCKTHPSFTGKTKPRADCITCWSIFHSFHPWCPNCSGHGKSQRPEKTCPVCSGVGLLPKDPHKEFVSEHLKPGQVFFPTYNPGILFQDPQKWEVLVQDFKRLPDLHREVQIESLKDYDEVPSYAKASEVLRQPVLSLDFETTGLDPTIDRILLLGASPKPLSSIILFEGHDLLLPYLLHPNIIGQNWMQFDAWWAWVKYGISPPEKVWDTRMAGHLLNPDTPNDLTYLTGLYAKPPAHGYWKTSLNYADNKPLVAMIDTDMTFRVKLGQEEALSAWGMLDHFLAETMPVAQVAFDMRRVGFRTDPEYVVTAHAKLTAWLEENRKRLPDWGGTHSEGQHAKVHHRLYTHYGLPTQLTKEGKPTANEEALLTLRRLIESSHPDTDHLTDDQASEALLFIDLVLDLRDQAKTKSFFKPDNIPSDNFVHPVWNSVGTATMRFTAKDPNPMVLPKCQCEPNCYGENPKCKGVRKMVLPDDEGSELMSVDISQAEVVGFLYIAEEWEVLDKVLNHGLDAHELMGGMMGMTRKDGKTATFAFIYGEHEKTTAARTHKPLAEIQAVRSKYVLTFPGIPVFRQRYIREAMDHGYVESPFGIRRHIHVTREVGRAANQAANAPIQNTPPMVVRRGMIKLHRELPKPARIMLNEHDELVFSYPKYMRKLMIEAVTDVLRAPIPEMPAKPIGMPTGLRFNIDIKVGPNWAAVKKLEEL